MQLTITCIIFVAAYALIISEKLDRAVAAMSGAVLMILVGVVNRENIFEHVDFATLTLLISMMVIVMVTKRCGIFQFLGIKAVKLAKADPFRVIVYLSLTTGVLSMFLDNVTTILLILPLVFTVCDRLKISAVPLIISCVFASNAGGTATLIGDPPNIMIGSGTGLSFMDFIFNIAPVAIMCLFVTTYIYALKYRKKLVASERDKAAILAMDENALITDKPLLIKSMIALGLTIVGFVIHGFIGIESHIIAFAGATLLMLLVLPSGEFVEEVLKEVEWKTILFFTGLFIMVGGLESAGVLKILADGVIDLTQGNVMFTAMAVLWVSAIASAFIDNIPFVATMIPLIKELGLPAASVNVVWWALSLGACLGGNGTIIGASANVIAAGLSEQHGEKITFAHWLKEAFPLMLLTIAVSTVYILVRYRGV